MDETATYICDSCGEEVTVPVDPTVACPEVLVEDCPVCCRPNVIHIERDENGEVRSWAVRE